MDVGGNRTDPGPDRKDSRKDDKYYSRHSSKDQPASSGRHFSRADRGDKYEGEGRGGRDEYRAVKDVGRSRDYDSRSGRDERGPRYSGNGFQDNGRDGAYRGGERREDARRDERRAVEDVGKHSSRRDDYRDNKAFPRKDNKFSDRRPFHGKEDVKQERGDRRESNGGTRRPEHGERGKRLEKSMKDIVDAERPVMDDIDEYLGNNERNRPGRFRGRDDFDNGKERLSSHTHRLSGGEKHGSRDLNMKSTEKDGAEQKPGGFTKLKLKVGGVTHTIVSDSAKKADAPAASVANKPRESESAGANKRRRQRLILQDQSDDDEGFDFPPPKVAKKTDSFSPGYGAKSEQKTPNGVKGNSTSRAEPPKTSTFNAGSSLQAVRKSSRVPKRRVLDGDEDDVEPQRPSVSSKGGRSIEEEDKEEEEAEAESSEDAGEESFEGLVDEDDEEEPELAKPVKTQQIRQMKEIGGPVVALTARQRAMQTSKDADSSAPSLIEFPEGLINPLSKKGKNNLSEAERQVKRVEAAHRRKQQVEKTARDIQATAIQRILGQDSTRKRRENRLEKQRQDIEEEKKAAELAPSTNSIRWNLGPSGSVVSFSEDVGLPSFFSSGPCRYPPPREKCAAPTCSNSYKYRDGKSNVPLCSLQCYKAVHAALPVTSTH
jgi:INO80 complex subunit B